MSDSRSDPKLPTPIAPTERLLTAAANFSGWPPARRKSSGSPTSATAAPGGLTRTRSATSCSSPASCGRRNSAPSPGRMSLRGVTTWRGASSAAPRSGIATRHCRRCSNISAKKTPSPTIRSKASSGPEPRAAKARRRRSAIIRRVSCSRHPAMKRSRRKREPRSCRRCSITRCAARSCASSRSRILETCGGACRI